MTKLEKLRFSSLVILGCFILAVAFHFWQSAYEGLGNPYNSPLFDPGDMGLAGYLGKSSTPQLSKLHCFGDLFLTWVHNTERDPYGASTPLPSNYLPFAHIVTLPFSWSNYRASILLFLVFALGTSIAFAWYHFRDSRTDRWENAKLVMIFALLPYPMWMVLDRGNIDIVVFLFCWLGVISFHRSSYKSAFFLGCATAMKGFPGLLLGLFVVKRRFRELAVALLCTVALNVVSMYFLKGGFWTNLQLISKAAERYVSLTGANHPHFARYTSGWLGMVAFLSHVFPEQFAEGSGALRWLSSAYPTIKYLLLCFFAVPLLGIRRLALWQMVAPLMFAMSVIPPAAFDYRLILTLIPFAMFIGSRRREPSDIWYALLFGLLMVPKQFVLVGPAIGIGTVINPIIMFLITGMILTELILRTLRARGSIREPIRI